MNNLLKALFIIVAIFSNMAVQANTVTNLVIPVSYFINHIKQLHELEQNLDKYKAASVVGTSGIGKTQLIRMYAYENRNKYKVIWFIDCNFDIKQEFLKLARAINISVNQQVISEDLTKIEEEVISYLAKLDNWLLIFDNNKIKSDFKLKKFIELEHNGHIVFCSQDLKGLPHIIKIKEFSKKDAEALAESILVNGTPEEINFIVEAFKGYPVLIVQGAQIVSNIRGLSKPKYKKMIQETDNKIKLNIELCKKELTPSANELLNKIALINNQSFSKDFLRMLTKHKETLDDDIYQLARFVLVSNTIYDEANPLFEMHDVIAEAIREINGKETNKTLIEEIISTVLVQSFPKGVARRHTVRTSSTVGENLQTILTNSEKFNIEILKNLELRLELFGTSTNNGDYNNAKLMVEWFEEKEKKQELDLNKMNNHEKYVYALYLDVIGCYKNYALSDPINAIEYFNKAKDIASKVQDYEYMKFNINYQLFRTLLDLGKIEEAEKTIQEVLAIYEEGTKKHTIDPTEISYFHIGKTRLLLAQEKHKEALEQVNYGIEALKASGLKETDMFLESSYQLKVEILCNLKQYQEAYTLAEWLCEIYKPIFPIEHEILANIYTKIAVAQYGLGKYEESMAEADKAIKMLIKVRNLNGEELQFTKDIQLAKALMVKADSLSALDQGDEALNIYEKAEAIHNNVYIENLNTSNSLKKLLFEATKTACQKPSKLNEFWFKHFYGRLRSIFGIDIPEVKEIEKTCNPDVYKTY